MSNNKQINKILVVGYGSMGRRRIRLTAELLPGASFICVDSNLDRQNQARSDGHLVFASIDEGIKENPQASFVCTSPGHHADIIIQLLSAGIHVFTELNLTSDRYDEIRKCADRNNVVIFLSSTLVYKRQMKYFCETVASQRKILTYMYHVGQYLPDWHPWESYKDFFIGKKETNGLREILAIQLPWIIKTFGMISNVYAVIRRCTELDIDYPDSAIVCIEHENGTIGSFLVDVVSRKATTHLEIIGEDIHIMWNGHNDDLYAWDLDTGEAKSVKLYDAEEHIDGYSDNISEEPYRDEIRKFILAINGDSIEYGLEDDKRVLDWIDKIESYFVFN